MERTLKVLNELEREGILRRYAIGGAIAALFYMDPFESEDLDVFIILGKAPASLEPLSHLYEELRRRGYREDGPYIIVEGVPVQFLLAYNPLIVEAVAQAREVAYGATPTRVPSAEHLAAIMVQKGRPKDRGRFEMMCEQISLDLVRLGEILARDGLSEKYTAWTR